MAAPTADRSLCAREQAFCVASAELETGSVLNIIDGDTLDVLIAGREERVRVFGIDAAERGEPCYAEAGDRLAELAMAQVRLRPDVRERDRSGRLLRYLYTNDGMSIDAVLISEGLAHAWTADGAMRDPLVALEAEARTAARGCLWGALDQP